MPLARETVLSKLDKGERIDFCPSKEMAAKITTKDVGIIRTEALELSYKHCVILPAGLGEQIGDYACLSVAMG